MGDRTIDSLETEVIELDGIQINVSLRNKDAEDVIVQLRGADLS
jgi:hypothetical protein